jgi:glutamate synthase (NADPH) small chain
MGKPTGFMEHARQDPKKRPVAERVADYAEVEQPLTPAELETQACRCMDCGIPYCHAFGCPLENRVPEFNDRVHRGQWQRALELLHATNNFPEITGRLCPALCEAACSLAVNQKPVTIRQLEQAIAERGWKEGWIRPEPPKVRTGRRVAVVGSGPAGLAAAQQLARAGHDVVVYEKSDRPGGILRYGIPDFKLNKRVLDRRLDQLAAEGVKFETGVDIGTDVSARYLRRRFDAVCITAGARLPRDLGIPGRGLDGIHFAMTYLVQQNRRNAGDTIDRADEILARGKDVVVVGGGDTGADCVGTARRQGAKSITQIELLPEPPAERPADNPWPTWPLTLRSSSSHEEGCTRLWSIQTKEFTGAGTHVRLLKCSRLEWGPPDATGRRTPKPIAGSDFDLKADLVLLALGFLHIEHGPIVEELDLAVDGRGNLIVDSAYQTNVPGVFGAGDSVAGASLVVRAIAQGREMAVAVDGFLREIK